MLGASIFQSIFLSSSILIESTDFFLRFFEKEERLRILIFFFFFLLRRLSVILQSICATEHGSRTTQRIWWRAPTWDDIVSFTVHPQRRRGAASSLWRVTLPPVPGRLIVILCRGRSTSRRTVGIISNCISNRNK